MKVKKNASAPEPVSTGGATIADRFRLDTIDTKASRNGTVTKKSATLALVFGLISLAISIALTATLYMHWDFLRASL